MDGVTIGSIFLLLLKLLVIGAVAYAFYYICDWAITKLQIGDPVAKVLRIFLVLFIVIVALYMLYVLATALL